MLSKLLIVCVRAYQILLGAHMGNCCRFEPSCSNYGIEALRRHGAWRGFWLTGRRVLRCHPFGPSGYDPVPPKQAEGKPKKEPHIAENRISKGGRQPATQ